MKNSIKVFVILFSILFMQIVSCRENLQPSLQEKVAQMVMIGFRGTKLIENQEIIKDIQQLKIGGVILFEYDVPSGLRPRNIASQQQLKNLCIDLQKLANNDLLIAIDQEGGAVNRLKERYGFSKTVTQQYLGMLNNTDSTQKYAQQTAMQLKEMGINLNFAPCIDVNVHSESPVIGKIGRSFSSNPEIVTQHAATVIAAHRQANIKTCIKHFPGHGSALTDSHNGFTDISNTWQSTELIPYKQLIDSGKCDAVMVGHLFLAQKDSLYPATLSKNMVQHFLRDSLGWQGVVFSDDMNMAAISKNFTFEEAIVLAINAGVDVLVYGNNSKSGYDENLAQKVVKVIVEAVQSGKIDKNRIEESYQRIRAFKSQRP